MTLDHEILTQLSDYLFDVEEQAKLLGAPNDGAESILPIIHSSARKLNDLSAELAGREATDQDLDAVRAIMSDVNATANQERPALHYRGVNLDPVRFPIIADQGIHGTWGISNALITFVKVAEKAFV